MTTVSSEINALQLDDILGSTLAAVVRAQGHMAAQLADFIEKVGFEVGADGQPLKARTFAFSFQRAELDKTTGNMVTKQVTAEVPLLSILSLPSLGVDEATVDFNLRVVAHDAGSGPTSNAASRMTPGIASRKLFALPAKRPAGTSTTDTTGALSVRVVVRRQETLGLQKLQGILDSATG